MRLGVGACGEHPECDLCTGWEGFLDRIGLAGEAAARAVLFTAEGSGPSDLGQQVAGVGDLVDDVVEQVG